MGESRKLGDRQFLVVQLGRAVEQWEPRTETVAVHAWLHPWLPYLGSRMDQLYPNISFKLSAALEQCHPSDQSALALLKPWHTVMLCTHQAPLHPKCPCPFPKPLSTSGPGTRLPPTPLLLLSTLLPSLRPKRQCLALRRL